MKVTIDFKDLSRKMQMEVLRCLHDFGRCRITNLGGKTGVGTENYERLVGDSDTAFYSQEFLASDFPFDKELESVMVESYYTLNKRFPSHDYYEKNDYLAGHGIDAMISEIHEVEMNGYLSIVLNKYLYESNK